MKTPFKISLLLNLGLSGALIFFWADRQKIVSESQIPVLPTTSPMSVAVPTPPPAIVAAPRVEPTPFDWSQLMSPDYHTYVQNLRRIGCPGPTLRAIVTADVDAEYRQRSEALEKKLDDLNHGSWTVQLDSYHDQEALKFELQKLPAEESAEIDSYLGLKPAAAEAFQPTASASQPSSGDNGSSGNQIQTQVAASNSAIASSAGSDPTLNSESGSTSSATDTSGQMALASQTSGGYQLPPTPKSATLPLVFQPVDPAAANLNASQQQAVNDLRQQFINDVSNSSQNLADPAYQQTWQQAQSQNDAMTVVQLGYNAYMQYWLAQYQNSLASQQSRQ